MRQSIAMFVVLAGCASAGTRESAEAPGTLVITHVTVVDGAGGPSRADQTVLVRGSRIVAVAPAAEVRVPRGATVVDGAGKYLIPGLWDMHTHVASYGDTTGRLALKLQLAHGITGIRDMGALDFARVKGWRDDVAAGGLLGPRMKIASPIVESVRWMETVRRWEAEAGKNTDWLDVRFGPRSADDAERFVDSAVAMGADHIKVRNWPDSAISAALVARARQRGIPVVAHPNVPFPETGVASYEHQIFPALRRSDAGRDSLFRQWAANGVAFVPTLVTGVGRLYPPDTLLSWIDPARDPKYAYVPAGMLTEWRQELQVAAANEEPVDWQAAWRRRLHEVREMRAAGVMILAASDFGAPLVVPGFDLHAELARLVDDLGMTPSEALRAATLDPARFLGMADSLGTVEAGKLADLVLLDADPLADIRNTRRIRAVVANGRLLDRRALDRLMAEAAAVMRGR
jgi:imidazolonepropionase-like amidohydrolase